MPELTQQQRALLVNLLAAAEKFPENSDDADSLIFRTSQLKKEHKGLYTTPNPSPHDTKDLFKTAIESLGFKVVDNVEPDTIRIGTDRSLEGRVFITGSPKMLNQIIDAAKKSSALKTSLEQFQNPAYQPRGESLVNHTVVAAAKPVVDPSRGRA